MSKEREFEIRYTGTGTNHAPSFAEFRTTGFSGKGKQVGEDQVPFDGNVTLTATNLRYIERLSNHGSSRYRPNHEGRQSHSNSISLNSSDVILGELRSGSITPQGFEAGRTYTFFGTSKPIGEFGFEIRKAEKEEFCMLMAFPDTRRTDQNGGERGDEGGSLNITIGLNPEKFDHLASRIRAGDIDWLNILLGDVDGFYVDKSSDGCEGKIKVMPYGGSGSEIQGIEKEELEKVPNLKGAGIIDLSFGRKAELLMETSLVMGSAKDPDQPHSANELTAMMLAELKKLTENNSSIHFISGLTVFFVLLAVFIIGSL